MILLPVNPNTARRWKTYNSTFCMNKTGQSFEHCIEDGAYTGKGIFLNDTAVTATPVYMSDNVGLFPHSIEIPSGLILYSWKTSLEIQLNSSLKYYIIIMDAKLQLLTASPSTFPRSLLTLPNYIGIVPFFLEVKLIFMALKMYCCQNHSDHSP